MGPPLEQELPLAIEHLHAMVGLIGDIDSSPPHGDPPGVVELAVAAGGVLIAVAVFVPAMPLAFTLAGVLLLLAGLTAGALLTRQARGVGWRLAVAAVLVAAVFGWYAYWDYTRNGTASTVWSLVIRGESAY